MQYILGMKRIKTFLSKYWLFILLAAIATIFAFFYVRSKNVVLEKKLLSLPIPKIESYKTSVGINYSPIENKLSSFGKEAEVFEVLYITYSDQEIVEIAQGFGFKDPPIVSYDQQNNGNVYSWGDEEKSLEINLALNLITYHLVPLSYQLGNLDEIDFDEAEKIAYEFLSVNNLLPPEGISLKKKTTSYIKIMASGIKKVESKNEADLIKIDFGYYLNEREIIGPFVSLTINSEKKVINFYYQPSFKQVSFFDKYPLQTSKEIIQKLKTIKAINYLYLKDSYGPTEDQSQNLKNIYLNDIDLIYYENIYTQSYLQPVFFISGQAILNDGRSAEVGIYLPAIKDEYLLK